MDEAAQMAAEVLDDTGQWEAAANVHEVEDRQTRTNADHAVHRDRGPKSSKRPQRQTGADVKTIQNGK